ncbi:hypothetical protein [Chryseosolibacter indicus]|uniref:Glycosyltransferase n=1 Tax=Chryseosolibacter indicus TaxID=2782351 RepID=A0ABS5VVP0_9BACT|nr:hypothetical protein [Chryseosolibacter indicus]MBT1705498.1 hypothetical protein [Chryseosolibacter indicus]
MKAKILILVLGDLKHDARVRRQVNALKEEYDVTIACFSAEPSDQYKFIQLPNNPISLKKKILSSGFLLAGFYSVAYKILYDYDHVLKSQLKGKSFDMVIANDVETLPLAFAINNRRVLFDAHEYAPRHFEDRILWRIFFQGFNNWLCRKYIPQTAAMTTVGKGLAEEYEKNFSVRPIVITNANNYSDILPSKIEGRKIKLVHHGIANRSRRLHLMIEMMDHLDNRFSLDFFLLTPRLASNKTVAYLEELKNKASLTSRVRILPPVTGTELVKTLNNYDIGIFLLPPVNFNYKNALPNKLFDFIQARLAIAIGPTPEMAHIVKEFQNGVVAEDFSPVSLAQVINKLTISEIETFKENSAKAAKVFNAENNAAILRDVVSNVLSK